MNSTASPANPGALAPALGAPAAGEGPPPQMSQPLSSLQLLQGRRMVEISHNGEVYRLQATRLGKLILTK